MASGHPTPRVPRWATHSFGVEVLLGNAEVHQTMELKNMAKAVMQDMEVSFLLGKKLNKRRVVSCSKIWL